MFCPINPRSFIDFDTAKERYSISESCNRIESIDFLLIVTKTCGCYSSLSSSHTRPAAKYNLRLVRRLGAIVLSLEMFIAQIQCVRNFGHCRRKTKDKYIKFIYLRKSRAKYLLTRNIDASRYDASLFQFVRLTNINQGFLRMIWQIFNFIVNCNCHIFFAYWTFV